jgi:hypothetical protein
VIYIAFVLRRAVIIAAVVAILCTLVLICGLWLLFVMAIAMGTVALGALEAVLSAAVNALSQPGLLGPLGLFLIGALIFLLMAAVLFAAAFGTQVARHPPADMKKAQPVEAKAGALCATVAYDSLRAICWRTDHDSALRKTANPAPQH